MAGLRDPLSRRLEIGGGMSTPFLKRLLQSCCMHRFSWPHNGAHGQDYQVCLICGATYAYDLGTMRRTRRLTAPNESGNQPLPGRQA